MNFGFVGLATKVRPALARTLVCHPLRPARFAGWGHLCCVVSGHTDPVHADLVDAELSSDAVFESRQLLGCERYNRNRSSRSWEWEQARNRDIIAKLLFAFVIRTAVVVSRVLGVGESSQRAEADE